MKIIIVITLAIIISLLGGVGQAAISSVCPQDSGTLLFVGSSVVGAMVWVRGKIKK